MATKGAKCVFNHVSHLIAPGTGHFPNKDAHPPICFPNNPTVTNIKDWINKIQDWGNSLSGAYRCKYLPEAIVYLIRQHYADQEAEAVRLAKLVIHKMDGTARGDEEEEETNKKEPEEISFTFVEEEEMPDLTT